MSRPTYIAAPPGEIFWRYEECPHRGAKVLLRTIGGVCITGQWYGRLDQYFTAWSPMPKDGTPPSNIFDARFFVRLKFALRLIFQPLARKRSTSP